MYKFYAKLPKKYLLPIEDNNSYKGLDTVNLKDVKYGDKGFFYIGDQFRITPFIVVYNKMQIMGVIFPYVYNDSNVEIKLGDDMVQYMRAYNAMLFKGKKLTYNYDNLLNKAKAYEIIYFKWEHFYILEYNITLDLCFDTFGKCLDIHYTKNYTYDMFIKSNDILNRFKFPSKFT